MSTAVLEELAEVTAVISRRGSKSLLLLQVLYVSASRCVSGKPI
jgi:hypothetical protein